jgi:hypothetical protein
MSFLSITVYVNTAMHIKVNVETMVLLHLFAGAAVRSASQTGPVGWQRVWA